MCGCVVLHGVFQSSRGGVCRLNRRNGGGFGGGGAFGSGGGVGFGSGGGAFGGGLPGFWSAPDGDLSGRGGVSGGFDGTGWSSNDQDSQWESSTWESVPKKSNRR